ncbi:MAG: arginase family protein [Nannocystaceae bacterium]
MTDLDRKFILAPATYVVQQGDHKILKNEATGTRVRTNALTSFLLETYRAPSGLQPLLEIAEADPSEPLPRPIQALLDHFILVDADDVDSVGRGVLAPIDRSSAIGKPLHLTQLDTVVEPRCFAVIGAPWQAGGSNDSSAHRGPDLIRAGFPWKSSQLEPTQSRIQHLDFRRQYSQTPAIVDLGDTIVYQTQDLELAGRRLSVAVERVLEHDMIPVVLGGDHSLTRHVIDTLCAFQSSFGIIHFDAHHDLYLDPFDNPNHANPFRFALAHTEVAILHQVGLRTREVFEPASQELAHDARVTYNSAYELRRSSPSEALAHLPRDIPYYVTFDIDCLDPSQCGLTDTPEPGGLGFYQALEFIDFIGREFDIIGTDFVEVGGTASSADNVGGACAASLLFQLMLGKIPYEPLGSYYSKSVNKGVVR